MSWLTYPNRKVTADHIQCPICGKMNSKYNQQCWNCKGEL